MSLLACLADLEIIAIQGGPLVVRTVRCRVKDVGPCGLASSSLSTYIAG